MTAEQRRDLDFATVWRPTVEIVNASKSITVDIRSTEFQQLQGHPRMNADFYFDGDVNIVMDLHNFPWNASRIKIVLQPPNSQPDNILTFGLGSSTTAIPARNPYDFAFHPDFDPLLHLSEWEITGTSLEEKRLHYS